MTTTASRITARVNPEVQELLLRAAALSGISSINSFVLSAAIEKAQNIVQRQERLELESGDAVAFVKALDRQPTVHKRLQKAAQHYPSQTL
jgi:uncharacterized protein (DUF1778 family)